MEFDDLHVFPPGHSPSPYLLPVKIRREGGVLYGTLRAGLTICAVGWLGYTVPTRGKTPDDCVDRLVQALDSDEVIWDGFHGFHECEICEAQETYFKGPDKKFGRSPLTRHEPFVMWRGQEYVVRAQGHHLVQLDQAVYVCPNFVLHYMLHHEYLPPPQFLRAVREGVFLTNDDLEILPPGGLDEWIERLKQAEKRRQMSDGAS